MRTAILILSLLVLSACSSEREFGGACDNDGDCADRCLRDFPGGLCTISCRATDECPSDTICVDTEGGVCLEPCNSNDDCRDRYGSGWACDDESTFDDREVRVCEDSG